jgi:hypothetical protein
MRIGTLVLCMAVSGVAWGQTRNHEPGRATGEPAPVEEPTPTENGNGVPRAPEEREAPAAPTVDRADANGEMALAASAGAVAQDLERARALLDRGQRAAGSRHLQQAAGVLRLQASAATAEQRETLERAASQLDELARVVAEGTGRLSPEVGRRIAGVEFDLAQLHLQNAQETWAQREARRAGHELRAAAMHVDNAARWTGVEAERVVREVTGDVLRISGRLVQGVALVPEEVGRAIERLGAATDRLGRAITPERVRETDRDREAPTNRLE